MAAAQRLVVRNFASRSVCKELEFIHKSCSVIGYRPHVRSTTLSHLIATNCSGLVLPFISLRERLKELVEAHFGCEFELFVEFTGLISWTKGASIGWHTDDNRPYLKQRHYAAVCYLNDFEEDFEGGLFHFQEGEPSTVVPNTGTVVVYTADDKNVHAVDEVESGERCTLALWFTRDDVHDEDRKLIQHLETHFDVVNMSRLDERLAASTGSSARPAGRSFYWFPRPASTNMYCAEGGNLESTGVCGDIRLARLESMGFVSPAQESLAHEDEMVEPSSDMQVTFECIKCHVSYSFQNSLHALQVLQFRLWKNTSRLGEGDSESPSHMSSASSGFCPNRNTNFKEKDDITEAKREWECYTLALWKELATVFPEWRNCGILFHASTHPNL